MSDVIDLVEIVATAEAIVEEREAALEKAARDLATVVGALPTAHRLAVLASAYHTEGKGAVALRLVT